MPADLLIVRHGESEGNVESAKVKAGDPNAFAGEFQRRHSSLWRLTEKGTWQARLTGEWIRREFDSDFDGYFVSTYIRAIETALMLNLPKAEWRLLFQLRERDWGQLDHLSHLERTLKFSSEFERRTIDGFYWAPPGGESMAQMCGDRLYGTLGTLHREFNGKQVIVVAHGDVARGYQILLERMSIERYIELERSTDPRDRIHNCQVIHYTRQVPGTDRLDRHFVAVRSLCPWDVSRSRNEWQPIERRKYTNDELRSIIGQVPRIVQSLDKYDECS